MEKQKRSMNLSIKCSLIIMIFSGLYICYHCAVLQGVLKERASKNCVGADEITRWENTLNIAEAICVDVQQNQLDEIKRIYETRATEAEAEAEKWKGYYNWQKKELNNLKNNQQQ